PLAPKNKGKTAFGVATSPTGRYNHTACKWTRTPKENHQMARTTRKKTKKTSKKTAKKTTARASAAPKKSVKITGATGKPRTTGEISSLLAENHDLSRKQVARVFEPLGKILEAHL